MSKRAVFGDETELSSCCPATDRTKCMLEILIMARNNGQTVVTCSKVVSSLALHFQI